MKLAKGRVRSRLTRRVSVTANVEVPCESAAQVTSVTGISMNGDYGIVSGERGYAREF